MRTLWQRLTRRRRPPEPHRDRTVPRRATTDRAAARKGLGGFLEWIEGGGVRPKK